MTNEELTDAVMRVLDPELKRQADVLEKALNHRVHLAVAVVVLEGTPEEVSREGGANSRDIIQANTFGNSPVGMLQVSLAWMEAAQRAQEGAVNVQRH